MHTFRNKTDYESLKPPLGLWCIALSYKIFGYNLFALRFYSVLATIFSVVLVMLILRKREMKLASLLAGFVLATSYAFLFRHSGRVGEF